MYLTFSPLEKMYKNTIGGVAENTAVRFFVESDADSVEMVFYGDNRLIARHFDKNNDGFYLITEFEKGLYFYKFKAVKGDTECFFGSAENLTAIPDGKEWQLTVYKADYNTPDWIKGGMIYQIFPDRFNREGDFTVEDGKVARYDWGGTPTFRSADGIVRNNEFFGGNFKGIEKKLDYLKSLNVTAIYLNPVCKSYSSHRYDTSDYLVLDSVLGGEKELKSLVKSCEDSEIRLIFDGVFNHVGADSVYFDKYKKYGESGACGGEDSVYREWFTFTSYPDEYECWWDFKTLPSIRKDCKSFQNFIADEGGVLEHWLRAGFSGVRLDVADELTDDFIAKIRRKLKGESADNLLIGEVWEDATNKIAYGVRRKYFTDGELDSVMNYPLKDGICDYLLSGNCAFLAKTVREQINNYPKAALDCLMNVLSTHDSVRAITLFGRKTAIYNKDEMANEKLTQAEYLRGRAKLKCASFLQFFLYGVPAVYYGDEEGLEGDLDPYNRRCFDWENIDEEIFGHYRRISDIRAANRDILSEGETEIITARKGLFVFSRKGLSGKMIFAVNLDNDEYIIRTEELAEELYGGSQGREFLIPPLGFLALKSAK